MDLQDKFKTVKYSHDPRDLEQFLLTCIEEGSEDGLNYVLQPINFYSTHNHGLISSIGAEACALTAMHWGVNGLSGLAETALNSHEVDAVSTILEILAYAASSRLTFFLCGRHYTFPYLQEQLDLTNVRYRSRSFINTVKEELLNIIVNYERKDHAPLSLTIALQNLSNHASGDDEEEYYDDEESTYYKEIIISGREAFDTLFAACSARWLRFNRKDLKEYISLLHKPDITEQEIHLHIAKNPYLLDPFYAHVWSKEQLGEKFEADFIVRLMDDNYIVVEIKKPNDLIMNKAGDLSAEATHAVRQAIEYRTWIVRNHLYVKQRFENIEEPSCLVVIGMENDLDEKQRNLLRQQNERGNLKIVGFDWLYRRANTILDNLFNHIFGPFEY